MWGLVYLIFFLGYLGASEDAEDLEPLAAHRVLVQGFIEGLV